MPGVAIYAQAADITSQVLNFGVPAPIDLQIRGSDLKADFRYANELLRNIHEAVEGWLSIDAQPGRVGAGDQVVEIAV